MPDLPALGAALTWRKTYVRLPIEQAKRHNAALLFRKEGVSTKVLGLTPFIVAYSHVLCTDQDSCTI